MADPFTPATQNDNLPPPPTTGPGTGYTAVRSNPTFGTQTQSTTQQQNQGTADEFTQATSTPGTTSTDQVTSDLLNRLSVVAANLSGSMLDWGRNVFNNAQAVTNDNIGRFLAASNAAMGVANSTANQYETKYVPEQNQLLADASSYTSEGRVAANMGAAESDPAQALEQGRIAA